MKNSSSILASFIVAFAFSFPVFQVFFLIILKHIFPVRDMAISKLKYVKFQLLFCSQIITMSFWYYWSVKES